MPLLSGVPWPPGGSWEKEKQPPFLCSSSDVKIGFPYFSAHVLLELPGQQLQGDEQPRNEGDILLSCTCCLLNAVVFKVLTGK